MDGGGFGSGGAMKMPKALTCYICGRGFMKSSISIHLDKCAVKFKQESESYGIKRKLPARPEKLDEVKQNFHSLDYGDANSPLEGP